MAAIALTSMGIGMEIKEETMSRDEMLSKLKTLRFSVFWPGNWEDIGFTERPIWVNSFGYGYYSCDEPCSFAVIEGISNEDIKKIKLKAERGTLTVDEVKESPFGELNGFDDDDCIEYVLDSFILLPDHINGQIFCGETVDGWSFFSSEEELIEAFDKGSDFWGGVSWDDMDNDLLTTWYNRICADKTDFELPMTIDIFKK